jgi:murein DD-endopeptidase MepM/ murein hydrolase activator NlpD
MIRKLIEIRALPRAIAACAALHLLVASPASLVGMSPQKSSRQNANHKRTASAEYTCGPGITLRLSSPASTQGNLLLLELRSTKALAALEGKWDEREVPFWEENKIDEKDPDVWHALLGVDLELKPGEYKLAVTGKTFDLHQDINCAASVSVRAGTFATEKLTVAPNFVEPNPEQLARAEAERQRLRAIFATVTPDRLWQGSFRVPLPGVNTGGNFGKRRILNGKAGSPHGGVDFPAPAGTPVYAAQRGRVVLAEPLYFSGNTVVIDHGLGLYTLYAHFESIAVQVGDLVDAGALLGKVGATGRVTGPHLHWGVTVNRARANPLQLISILGQTSNAG